MPRPPGSWYVQYYCEGVCQTWHGIGEETFKTREEASDEAALLALTHEHWGQYKLRVKKHIPGKPRSMAKLNPRTGLPTIIANPLPIEKRYGIIDSDKRKKGGKSG